MCILLNAQLWHFMFTLFSSCSTFAHNQLTLSLDPSSLLHQVYTRDWDSSTTDNQTAPHTTSLHAFINIMIGFTLER